MCVCVCVCVFVCVCVCVWFGSCTQEVFLHLTHTFLTLQACVTVSSDGISVFHLVCRAGRGGPVPPQKKKSINPTLIINRRERGQDESGGPVDGDGVSERWKGPTVLR